MPQPGDLFDLVHESIIVHDMDGRVLAWNAASAELYGWKDAEAVGRNMLDLFGTGSAIVAPELLATGRWEGQVRRPSASATALVVEARQSLRRDADGRPNAVVEVGRDITAKLNTEAALSAAERRYTNLFQAMAASFWELDFLGVGAALRQLRKGGVTDYAAYLTEHPDLVREMMRATSIVDVNEETVRLFAGGDRALLKGSVEPFWPEESSHVFAASVVAAVGGAPSYSTETVLRRANGETFEALFTAAFPAESVGQGALLIGVVDISERKRAQKAARQLRDEFSHAARISMLGELAASIAHEVNQPLAAIATNASASLRWLNRETPDIERASRLSERILADAQRAADIIGRIRNMASKQSAEPRPLVIDTVIDETVAFLQHELQGHGVTLTRSTAPQPPAVLGDRTQLHQVFANLAINAIQAMAQAGVAEPRLSIRTVETADGRVQVIVEDNGPGLDPETADRLFQSFYTTKTDGMGMGLAICRSIIEDHGGAIDAGNRPERGATFTVSLPRLTA